MLDGGYPFFASIAPRIEQVVPSPGPPIVTLGAMLAAVVPESYWVYNTEDLHHREKLTPRYRSVLDCAARVFDYAEPNVATYPRGEFCPIRLGTLGTPSALDACDIDVLFYGYLTPRRERIVRAVGAYATDRVHGDALAVLVRRARVVLSLGAYDHRNNDAFRVFPALEAGGRLVVEACDEAWFNEVVVRHAPVVPYEDLIRTCRSQLTSLS